MSGPYWQDQFNPVRGCTEASPGCANCYARAMHDRFHSEPFSEVRLLPEVLSKPLRRRKPTTYFVCNTSDLFHPSVTDNYIAAVFGVMAACSQHTFLVLTKRAQRMRTLLTEWDRKDPFWTMSDAVSEHHALDKFIPEGAWPADTTWPLPNVWLGVTTEDQEQAEKRIPHLLATPAAHRWVSVEPMLGPIDFSGIGDALFDRKAAIRAAMNGPAAMNYEQADAAIAEVGLSAVIVGGESGAKARPCEVEWIRSIVRQCKDAAVPCFVKQLGSRPIQDCVVPLVDQSAESILRHGEYDPDPIEYEFRHRSGADPSEWPEDLRVRDLGWSC